MKIEIGDLQERYIDVVGMLRETENELKRVTSLQRFNFICFLEYIKKMSITRLLIVKFYFNQMKNKL